MRCMDYNHLDEPFGVGVTQQKEGRADFAF